jgi:hypothetical protein
MRTGGQRRVDNTDRVNNRCATGAMPIGAPEATCQPKEALKSNCRLSAGSAPGCPELAFATTSAARVRMVAIDISSAGWGAKFDMSELKR